MLNLNYNARNLVIILIVLGLLLLNFRKTEKMENINGIKVVRGVTVSNENKYKRTDKENINYIIQNITKIKKSNLKTYNNIVINGVIEKLDNTYKLNKKTKNKKIKHILKLKKFFKRAEKIANNITKPKYNEKILNKQPKFVLIEILKKLDENSENTMYDLTKKNKIVNYILIIKNQKIRLQKEQAKKFENEKKLRKFMRVDQLKALKAAGKL